MKKNEKILLIGTIGLGLVLAATVLPGKGKGGKPEPEQTEQTEIQGVASKKKARPTLELLASGRVEFEPLLAEMRNPFRAPAHGEENKLADISEKVWALKVTGIFNEGGGLVAMINGKRRRTGDTIDGLTVRHITRSGIGFEYEGKYLFRTLYKPPTKGTRSDGGPAGAGSDTTKPGTR